MKIKWKRLNQKLCFPALLPWPAALQTGVSQARGNFCEQAYTLGHTGLAWAGLGWACQTGESWRPEGMDKAELFRGKLAGLHTWFTSPLASAQGKLWGEQRETPGKRNRRKKKRLRFLVDLARVNLTGLPSSLSSTQIESFAILTPLGTYWPSGLISTSAISAFQNESPSPLHPTPFPC